MRRYLILFFILLSVLNCRAQISYGDMTWGSHNMKINVSTENDSIFLTVIYSDTKKKLTDTPKLLIRLMDDSVISLEGKLLGFGNKSDGGVVISGVIVEDSYYVSEAKFPIQKEQILDFKKGIKKLRLNTSPKYHEKSWTSDKIGRKLYGNYLRSSSNSFEDGF